MLLLSCIKRLNNPRIVYFDKNRVHGKVCSCRSKCGESRSALSFLLFWLTLRQSWRKGEGGRGRQPENRELRAVLQHRAHLGSRDVFETTLSLPLRHIIQRIYFW